MSSRVQLNSQQVKVEFFYDTSSPWTYLAFARIREVCKKHLRSSINREQMQQLPQHCDIERCGKAKTLPNNFFSMKFT